MKTFGFFSFFSFKCLDFYVNIRNVLFSNRPVSKSSNHLYSMRLLSMLFSSCCYSSIKILSLKITRSHSVQNRIWICRKFFTAASQDICNLNSLCGWFVSWASYSIFHKGWNLALKENTCFSDKIAGNFCYVLTLISCVLHVLMSFAFFFRKKRSEIFLYIQN